MGVRFPLRRRRVRCLATSSIASRPTRSRSELVRVFHVSLLRGSECQCLYAVSADVEVSCYAYEGIDAVKSALKAGLQQSTEEMPLDIRLIAPPQYVITTTTLDRTEGIAKLNTAIQVSQRAAL